MADDPIQIPHGFTLMDKEKSLWYGKYSWKASWLLIIIGILTIVVYGLGIFILAYVALKVHSTEYFITDKRIYIAEGVISRRVIELKTEWLIRTSMIQDISGRLLDFGTIVLVTPEEYKGKVPIIGVENPQQLLQTIETIKVDKTKNMPKFQVYTGPG